MKKVIMIATIYGFIKSFEVNNIKILQDLGYEVHTFANETNTSTGSKENVEELENLNIHTHFVPFHRNPFHIDNYRAYKDILDFITRNNDISFIDCHTPVGGVVGRLAAKKSKIKCIYTAHGFHFYKGAPLINWLIYYPIEKCLSRYTDTLVTINTEDYTRSKEKFYMKHLEYIPGVGINVEKFRPKNFDRGSYRKSLGINENDFAILSVGELNRNKNHEVIIRAIAKLQNNHIHYFIAGKGNLEQYLLKLSEKLGVSNNVHLLGYRNDISQLNNSADIFAFPSIREGLGLAAIEAMATGLPLLTSDTRGINDYSIQGVSGFKCVYNDIDSFSEMLNKLLYDYEARKKMSKHNLIYAKKYDIKNVDKIMRARYETIKKRIN